MDTATIAPSQDARNAPPDPDEPVVDATIVEEHPTAGAVVVRNAGTALGVTPQVQAVELVERLDVIKQAMENAMQEDVDYGRIPGAGKPSLFKPGAEKLGVLFQLDIQVANDKAWGPGDHLTVTSRATAYHAPTGTRLGFGEGICTTREGKYAKRMQSRSCPTCRAEAIIKGKQEYGGGWVCFKKKGGCGAKWPDGAEVIEDQVVGEIENPDLPDMWNTVVKMAAKRARVDAVLAVTGASALFTQDVEDHAPQEPQTATPSGPVTQQVKLASDDLSTRAKDALRVLLGEEDARATYRLIVKACQHGPDVKGLTHDAATAVEVFAAAAADLIDGEPTS